jgi:hypothetical protein
LQHAIIAASPSILPSLVASAVSSGAMTVALRSMNAIGVGAPCSDGFEIGCDSGERVRIAFALDC